MFALIADPRSHGELDGSGTVGTTVTEIFDYSYAKLGTVRALTAPRSTADPAAPTVRNRVFTLDGGGLR